MKTELPKITDLTDEQINVLIAEHLGWTRCVGGCQPKGEKEPRYWRTPTGRELRECPSYCSDLNAAIPLCDLLDRKGWAMASWRMNGCKFEVVFYNGNEPTVSSKSKSLSMAISRAFLLATGKAAA